MGLLAWDDVVLYGGIAGVVLVVLALVARFRSRRTDRLMSEGAVVVVGDHSQDFDPVRRVGISTASPMAQTTAQRRRRSSPIAAYVGLNGSAKTATCVRDTLPDLAAGRHVLSTVALVAAEPAASREEADQVWARLAGAVGIEEELLPRPADPLRLPHPLWVPFVRWSQLTTFKQGVVIMDEVQGLADSRESQSMPVQVSNKLFQLRRDGVILRWTTIDYTAADKRLRRATQTVTLCRGFLRYFVADSIWPRFRFFWIRTYDGRGFDDFTSATNRQSKDHRPRSICREWCRIKGRLWDAVNAYDSESAVLALGDHLAGMCMTCNGRRSVPRCSCPDQAGATEARPRRTPRKRSEEGPPEAATDAPVEPGTGRRIRLVAEQA